MPGPLSRRLFGRRHNSTGLLLAAAFALIGAGVVLFVSLSSTPRRTGAAIDSERIRVGDMPANPGEATNITAVGTTRDAVFQVADKHDPSRIAYELLFARLDPAGTGVFDASEPRAWLYMKDGRTVYIRADSGVIHRSATASTPESGKFTGNGLLLMFPPRPAGSDRPIDPAADVPGLVGHFDTASFDTVLLEISSADPWTLESEEVWADGTGFVVRANQVLERLEFAKIDSGGQIRYRTDRPSAGEPVADRANPPAAEAHGQAASGGPEVFGPTRAPQPVKEDLYLAEFRDGVKLVQTGRTLSADLLSVWARMIDNKLPEGALGSEPAKGAKPHQRRAMDGDAGRSELLPVQAQLVAMAMGLVGPSPTLFHRSEMDVVLTWTGGMVARPLAAGRAPPAGLADGNHLFARFTAAREGGQTRVTMRDLDTGAAGVCAVADYAATKRELAFASGPGCERVDFTAPGAGRLVGPSLGVSLATGDGHVRGAGVLVRLRDEGAGQVTVRPEYPRSADPDAPMPEDADRRITWEDRADFKFRVVDGKIIDSLERARFEGGVAARDGASMVLGRVLAADFVDRPEKKMSLTRVKVGGDGGYGGATAIGRSTRGAAEGPGRDSCISADDLEVRFAPSAVDPREDDATLALATGRAHVTDRKGEIAADRLEAQLVRTGKGATEPGEVNARGGVRTEMFPAGGGGSIVAMSDDLHADGQRRWADLTGERVTIERAGSVIAGSQMHLEEDEGRLEVFGAGSVRHVQRAGGSAASEAEVVVPEAVLENPGSSSLPVGVSIVRATWTRSMSFNDRTGRIECHGDATVTSTDSTGGQVSRSERLFLNITPRAEAGRTAAGGVTIASESGARRPDDRKLLRAESLGASLERDDGKPASVKSWRLAAAGGADGEAEPRGFEQVLYLEGPRIISDEVAGTVTIPDAGRGVTFDAGKAGAHGPSVEGVGGSSGRSRFTWAGSMDFNRLSGLLHMHKDVELRHLPLNSTELMRMNSDVLTATFSTRGGGGGGAGKGTDLLTAEAAGAVYAESGTRHLVSDLLTYDSPTGVAVATATGESPVSMLDDKQGSPVLARALRWETRTDRVEVTEPMPVTGGR